MLSRGREAESCEFEQVVDGDRSADGKGILTDSHRRLEYVLSKRLPWWKLPWKVDDVRAEVEAAIQNSFAKDAELKLVFEADRLVCSSLQLINLPRQISDQRCLLVQFRFRHC